ncbi:unnamed protein product, partial [Didymodactylos carnosus]
MDFGSKYVYAYNCSSEEDLSDSGDESNVLNIASTQPFAEAAPLSLTHAVASGGAGDIVKVEEKHDSSNKSDTRRKTKQKRRLRKADTNVLSVQFNHLLKPTEMHAGDIIRCEECSVIASHLSKIKPATGETAEPLWECEFCRHHNSTDIEQSDLPKQEDVTYLVEPAPVVHGADMTGLDNSIVIFVIDISGSMSSTTSVSGTFRMPNAHKQQQRAAENFGGEQMIRDRHQSYVTRLQGVQMAVDANLDTLIKEHPTRRAALLTFNHELTYYGDGTREPLVIRGDKLDSKEDIILEAEEECKNELKPILETKQRLVERVYDLEEGGQTALGPAVVFALHLASKRRGSKIVICTDGLANRGIGNLEAANDEKSEGNVKKAAIDQGNEFYGSITDVARDKGVSISVVTMKGTTCFIPLIGQMADGSGGQVTIVDLTNIRDEFASILKQQVIASNVSATLIVHRGLYIRNPANSEIKLNKSERDIGNVTKDTEVTF